jgi:galactose oxidase
MAESSSPAVKCSPSLHRNERYPDPRALGGPQTTEFFKMAPNDTPRYYHSVALLLPDATVITSGGDLRGSKCSANHFNGQFYSPPYLFLSDGVTRTPRPVIESLSPSTARIGDSITITMQSPAASFTLIRICATTYSVDTGQRRIPLTAAMLKGLSHTVWVPADTGVAVPRNWVLFALDGNGVPSLAKILLITL